MKMNKKTIFAILGVVIVVFGVIAYVLLRQRGPKKYTGPLERITFGVDFSVISAPVWVAEKRGYFQKEGLDVKIRDYSSGITALRDMLEKGNLNMVTVAQTPVMYNSFSKNNYAIIAAMACSYEDVLLLTRGENGIKTSTDLKGKKIGTPVGSSGHFFLGLFLVHNGLKISDVTVIDIDAPDLPKALSEGRVDAIAIWQPHIYNAQKLLDRKTLLLPSKNIYREDFYFVPNKNFIKNNPEALKKFLKAIDRAENFIHENREEAINVVSERLRLDRETVNSFWNGYEFKLFLDQTVLTGLEAEARWAIKNKYTTAIKIPDYLDFIRTDALKAIKPEAVNIIR
jgi:NitT/TauT family transport system substrate-binding protein